MAFATYQLNSETRRGSIGVLHVDGQTAQHVQTIELKMGVFDMKWKHGEVPVLAVAGSDGSISLYAVDKDSGTLYLQKNMKAELENGMALSLDWSCRVQKADSKLVVTSSESKIACYAYSNERGFCKMNEWRGHDLFGSDIEVWIAAFNYYDTNVVFSGGDDGILKGWDVRSASRMFQNRNCHEMGICSIMFNPHKEFCAATGSYDEQVQIWDTRNMVQPVLKYGTGGGVWRIKWHPTMDNVVVTANMRGGFQVLRMMHWETIEQKFKYEQHESLAYGVDWLYGMKSGHTIGTASFYDHACHVWQLEDSVIA